MNIKLFCRCSFFLPGRAKDLSAPLYILSDQFKRHTCPFPSPGAFFCSFLLHDLLLYVILLGVEDGRWQGLEQVQSAQRQDKFGSLVPEFCAWEIH